MGRKIKQYSSHKDSSRTSSRSALASPQQDGYRFSLVNGQVSSLQEYEKGRWKNEKIDRNESWSFNGTTLTKTEIEGGRIKTSTYLDADGDGIFTRSGRDVVTGIGSGTGSGSFSYPSYGFTGSLEDSYRFSLVNGQVSNLQEYERGSWKNENIGRNESWSFDGSTLTKTETERGRVKTSTYLDADGDGVFTRSGRDVVTRIGSGGGSESSYSSYGSNRSLEDSYRFSLVNGQVSNLQEYERGSWKNENIGRNESWSFDGTNLIQQEIKRYGMEVSTYTDSDGDGIFSKVSEAFNPLLSSSNINVF
jgi:hypothetical protein